MLITLNNSFACLGHAETQFNHNFCVRKLSLIYENLMNWCLKMKIILAALIILLMMPISYAMLDEVVRKIRIKIRLDS